MIARPGRCEGAGRLQGCKEGGKAAKRRCRGPCLLVKSAPRRRDALSNRAHAHARMVKHHRAPCPARENNPRKAKKYVAAAARTCHIVFAFDGNAIAKGNPVMATFNYDNIAVDFDSLPEASRNAVIQRGINHIFGSEADAKVGSAIKRRINPEKPSEVAGPAIKSWREANSDESTTLTETEQARLLEALQSGTLGIRVGGSRVDPMTKYMQQLAATEVFELLKKHGAIGKGERKRPSGDTEFTILKEVVTWNGLVARRLANAKEGPRIRKEAEQHFASLARQAKKADEAASVAAQASSLEEMGL